ncbi:MAG: MerR family transcriptional regulator [Firmicutes bacterium]|nr:MerR family transcriptional regulator [Bacillota bacterium]
MRTVKEVSNLTGISVRTLHYYDQIGLLVPTAVTESGYRLYDDNALEKLQQIMLYRELEFPLRDIKNIMESTDFDRNRALQQQIEMLTLKKEHLENLITFARGIELLGVNYMDFTAFDTKKLDEYAEEAKKNWGKTDAYREYEEKMKGMSKAQENKMGAEIMVLFVEFGEMIRSGCAPGDDKVQAQVKRLQDFITENFYTCTNQILSGLGKMYAGGGEFTANIDKAGGEGTAAFVNQAIEEYCK